MMINIQLTLTYEINPKSDSFLYNFNMGFLKVLGRILIITALASSAFHHLRLPQQSVEEFRSNYKTLDTLSATYLNYDIPFDNANWLLGVRLFGGFEALVACLIIFGDPMGSFLYVVSIVFEIFFWIWPSVVARSFTKWNYSQMEELSQFLTLLGIGLVLVRGGCEKGDKKGNCGK